MNSYIFQSTLCRDCNPGKTSTPVFRTPTKDICANCGVLLQEFPAITAVERSPKLIAIPIEVSVVLEKLLRRRLFVLESGEQPKREDPWESAEEGEIGKQPAHRIGSQCRIKLHSSPNLTAVIRWNYSQTMMISAPRTVNEKTETSMSWLRPARISRAADALSECGFIFTGSYRSRGRTGRFVRFERHHDVVEQPLDTTDHVCLVVKIELGWVNVGHSFASDAGARQYRGLSDEVWGAPKGSGQTLEAAIELALHQCRQTGGEYALGRVFQEGIFDPLLSFQDPCFLERMKLAKRPCPFLPSDATRTRDQYPPVPTDDGRFSLPLDVEFAVHVECSQSLSGQFESYPPAAAVMKEGDQILFAGCFGEKLDQLPTEAEEPLPKETVHDGNESYGGRMIYYSRFRYRPAKPVTVELLITDREGLERTKYDFVPMREYNRRLEKWEAGILDQSKCKILADLVALENHRFKRQTWDFASGQAVGLLLDGQWYEGTYAGVEGGRHFVELSERYGVKRYQAVEVKPLEILLEDGIDVRAPFDKVGVIGFAAHCQ